MFVQLQQQVQDIRFALYLHILPTISPSSSTLLLSLLSTVPPCVDCMVATTRVSKVILNMA